MYDVEVDFEPESEDAVGMDYASGSDVGDDEDYTPTKKYNYNKKTKKLINGGVLIYNIFCICVLFCSTILEVLRT